MSEYVNLFHSIKNQNDALSNTKKILKDRYSIDDKRIDYQTEEIGFVRTINNYLFYFYFILAFVIVFILIFSKKDRPLYIRFLIGTLFVVYPFMILWLEGIIYETFKYTFALMMGKVYDPPTKPLSISEI